MDWQAKRHMTGREYKLVLAKLKMSMAAAARYLDVSSATARRYGKDRTEIPVAHVLLLRALVELAQYGVKPSVPPWTKAWEKRQ